MSNCDRRPANGATPSIQFLKPSGRHIPAVGVSQRNRCQIMKKPGWATHPFMRRNYPASSVLTMHDLSPIAFFALPKPSLANRGWSVSLALA
jgi:hypothetical protein